MSGSEFVLEEAELNGLPSKSTNNYFLNKVKFMLNRIKILIYIFGNTGGILFGYLKLLLSYLLFGLFVVIFFYMIIGFVNLTATKVSKSKTFYNLSFQTKTKQQTEAKITFVNYYKLKPIIVKNGRVFKVGDKPIKTTTQSYQDFLKELDAYKHKLEEANPALDTNSNYCSVFPDNLEGKIDPKSVLKKANLDYLVDFFDEYHLVKSHKHDKDLFYLNESKPVNKNFSMSSEFGQLWFSNNMSLLNNSMKLYGNNDGRIKLGGMWNPDSCKSRTKVAIIIPYRDRLAHLKILIFYLHMILQRQLIDYRIFVVEPTIPLNVRFNKGRVYNAAFIEILKIDPTINCFVLHDVDLLPEDDRNIYRCTNLPKHMSPAVDKFNYILPYHYLVGGVLSLKKEIYSKINGYSNMYWGWGAEDDDLFGRLKVSRITIFRPPLRVARYRMLRHKLQEINPRGKNHLRTAVRRFRKDGLSDIKYNLLNISLYTGFTHILVDVGSKHD